MFRFSRFAVVPVDLSTTGLPRRFGEKAQHDLSITGLLGSDIPTDILKYFTEGFEIKEGSKIEEGTKINEEGESTLFGSLGPVLTVISARSGKRQ